MSAAAALLLLLVSGAPEPGGPEGPLLEGGLGYAVLSAPRAGGRPDRTFEGLALAAGVAQRGSFGHPWIESGLGLAYRALWHSDGTEAVHVDTTLHHVALRLRLAASLALSGRLFPRVELGVAGGPALEVRAADRVVPEGTSGVTQVGAAGSLGGEALLAIGTEHLRLRSALEAMWRGLDDTVDPLLEVGLLARW